jgi:hypothetical protein
MTRFPYFSTRLAAGPQKKKLGRWQVTLHEPVLVYQGTREEHITRPNLCFVDDAIAAIFQTTFDTNSTPHDRKDVWVTLDGGATWQIAARGADVGSYSLYSQAGGPAVVLPYDSLRFGATRNVMTGPRATLRWSGGTGGKLGVTHDTTEARFPETLKGFVIEPIKGDDGKPLYLENDLPPEDKPITAFWGTVQKLPDGRWIVPAYGCFESEPVAHDSLSPDMRRMARFSTHLMVSGDQGRTWTYYSTIAKSGDVPKTCVEGPSEVQLFFYPGLWRAVFRVSALKNLFQPMHYAESRDEGRTWTKPAVLPNVDMIMDPRGIQLPGGVTVLSAGRPKIDLFLAQDDSLEFHKLDMAAHHNTYLPRLRTTGHTDVVAVGPRSFLFIYDYIPDSWRWPTTVFTAPDAIFSVRVDLEDKA